MRGPLPLLCYALLASLLFRCEVSAQLKALEIFPEPDGLRVLNQDILAGVLLQNAANVDLTQTFTLDISGSVTAVGFAFGFPDGTPSITTSLHRVSNGVVDPTAIATAFLDRNFFEHITVQTVPLWIYAEFTDAPEVAAGEQLAFRIQSGFAQLWGPRTDALPGGEIVQMPGTDLAFRTYVVPEPTTGLLWLLGVLRCSTVRRRLRLSNDSA
jgi:hypothetical protein